MKNLKIFKQGFSFLTASFILTCMSGCSNDDKKLSSDVVVDNTNTTGKFVDYNYHGYLDRVSPFNNIDVTESLSDYYEQYSHDDSQQPVNSNVDSYDVFDYDSSITDYNEENNFSDSNVSESNPTYYFELAKEEVRLLLESEQYEAAKEKGKEVVKAGVDFIFYDKEIGGITFDQLTEEGKKVTYESITTIDGWIMEVFPNYKEEIGEKYQIVSDFISEKYYSLKEEIKKYLGDDNYNAVLDIKDKLGNSIEDGYESVKEKTKNWYYNNFN